jgi:hypothetical protein
VFKEGVMWDKFKPLLCWLKSVPLCSIWHKRVLRLSVLLFNLFLNESVACLNKILSFVSIIGLNQEGQFRVVKGRKVWKSHCVKLRSPLTEKSIFVTPMWLRWRIQKKKQSWNSPVKLAWLRNQTYFNYSKWPLFQITIPSLFHKRRCRIKV